MGIDLLDITFRIKARFGVHVPWEAMDEVVTRRPRSPGNPRGFDITADELCGLVESTLAAHRRRLAAEARDNLGRGVLAYEGKGGRPAFDGDVWPEVRKILADIAGAPLTEIDRDTWVFHDLGLS